MLPTESPQPFATDNARPPNACDRPWIEFNYRNLYAWKKPATSQIIFAWKDAIDFLPTGKSWQWRR